MKRIIFLFMLTAITVSNAQDMQKINSCWAKGDYINGVKYSKRLWNKTPSLASGYNLAYGYYQMNNIDSAAFFSDKVLYDKSLSNTGKLTVNQYKNLEVILRQYNKKGMTRKFHYAMSSLDEMTNKDALKSKALAEGKVKDTTPEKNVFDNLPEGDSPEIINEVEDTIFEITWKDSTNTNGITENQLSYPKYYFPELYYKREFLMYPMVILYKEYLSGTLDPDNYFMRRYELNKYNIPAFIEVAFPEIYKNSSSLDSFSKKYVTD